MTGRSTRLPAGQPPHRDEVFPIFYRNARGASLARIFELSAALRADAPLFTDLDLIGPPEPVFKAQPRRLRARLLEMGEGFKADDQNDLASYFQAFASDDGTAAKLRERLRGILNVTSVEIQGRPRPAFILDEERLRKRRDIGEPPSFVAARSGRPEPIPYMLAEQGYLGPSPAGIDAAFAWQLEGGRGEGVRVVDIEDGWNLAHVDLLERHGGVIHGSRWDDDHGTAVFGIIGGDENRYGVTGIAPHAYLMAASATYDGEQERWNAADAIRAASERLRAGDIILLEMHAPGPHSPNDDPDSQEGFIPVEAWAPDRAAIREATSRGIYVVEAAGNGGETSIIPTTTGSSRPIARTPERSWSAAELRRCRSRRGRASGGRTTAVVSMCRAGEKTSSRPEDAPRSTTTTASTTRSQQVLHEELRRNVRRVAHRGRRHCLHRRRPARSRLGDLPASGASTADRRHRDAPGDR